MTVMLSEAAVVSERVYDCGDYETEQNWRLLLNAAAALFFYSGHRANGESSGIDRPYLFLCFFRVSFADCILKTRFHEALYVSTAVPACF